MPSKGGGGITNPPLDPGTDGHRGWWVEWGIVERCWNPPNVRAIFLAAGQGAIKGNVLWVDQNLITGFWWLSQHVLIQMRMIMTPKKTSPNVCVCRFLQDPKHTLVHYVLFMDMVGRGEWIRPLQREFLFVLLQDSVQSIIYWMQSTKIHARRKYCKQVYIHWINK